MAVVAGSARMAHALLERLEAEGTLIEGLRCEILNGELVIRGWPLTRHERVVSVLMYHLTTWKRARGGEVFAGLAIEIGDQQLVPDVSFMGPERAGEIDEGGFHVPPDLVVEVTSPGTRSLDLREKRDIYQAIGVGEYWVVDLAGAVVVVDRRDQAGRYALTEAAAGTLTVLTAPGLEVPVAELLAAHPPPQHPASPSA
ncbi:MAG: Uma2 family endonuclease [Egibacteraceae bacterium]